jgi:photosystem II stability/assembly factor-like uncharacterized protein
MKKIILILLFALTANISYSQNSEIDWKNVNREHNFYDIQADFNNYWDGKNITPETPKSERAGWKQFKRYEWFWEQRVYPSGEFPKRGHVFEEYQKLKNRKTSKNKLKFQDNDGWVHEGPSTADGGYTGLGRLNCIIEDPEYDGSTNKTLWVGAASGGIWKSTNDGATWTTNTDDLSVLGIGDITIDPTDSDIMYVATGDGDGSDTYSIGILKSTDGGQNWNTTGFQRDVDDRWVSRRLAINPDKPDTLFVATNGGLYITTNGGTNWTQKVSGSFWDVKINPANSDTVYAAKGNAFYRSINGGDSFSQITDGLPSTSSRFALAVTPANSDYVYVLSSNSSGGFNGLYKSTNAGESFETASTTPNILNSSQNGSGSGGQGWYDLAIAVNPEDEEHVFVGGINIWQSTDGGDNWDLNTYWYNIGSVEEVHADHHMLYFPDSERLYSANDGGLDVTDDFGENWNFIGSGLKITQFYRISVSQSETDEVLGGAQDNSSFLKKTSSFGMTRATGDGMDQAINPDDGDEMFTASYFGNIYRTTNGGTNWSIISKPSNDENGAWVTPYLLDPNDSDVLFAGYESVWKTSNDGNSWTLVSDFSNSSTLTVLHVAYENSDYIYAGRSGALWMTSDGGDNWSSLSLPSGISLTRVESNPNDSEEIWITSSGYSSGNKVFHSTNAGGTWTNISDELPNVPANCIIFQPNYKNRLYVGTDIGVFYYDDETNGEWTDFNTDLPNVIVNDLEIQFETNKLFAGTYGRGLWSVSIPEPIEDPHFVSSSLDENNAFIEIEFNEGVWSDDGATNPLTSNSFNVLFESNGGNATTCNIDSLATENDEELSGGESIVRVYLEFDAIPNGLETLILEAESDYIYDVDGNPIIDNQETDLFTLNNGLLNTLVFEDFEHNGDLPDNWTNSYEYGTINWTVNDGGQYGNPSSAYEGDYNCFFYNSSYSGYTTKLITPAIEFGNYKQNGKLNFYHAMANWDGDIDELRIYYKNSDAGNWYLLAEYEDDVSSWTEQEIELPNLTDTYYIAFEGTQNYGYGVCIDNVDISAELGYTIHIPILSSPANNSSNTDVDITLSWLSDDDADSYTVQLSEISDFTTTIVNANQTASSYDLTNLDYNTTYYWRVNITTDGETGEWSEVWSFTTKEISIPELISPSDGSIDRELELSLEWNTVTEAESYDYEIASDSEFTSVIDNGNTESTSQLITELNYSNTYYWRVRSVIGEQHSDWSEEWSFTTKDVPVPVLSSPDNNSTDTEIDLTLSWQSNAEADSYTIQVSENSDFSAHFVNQNITSTDYILNSLDYNTIYYWRVNITANGQTSDWSDAWEFTTKAITVPILSLPVDAALNQEVDLTIEWNSAADAENYDYEIASDSEFTSVIDNGNTESTSQLVTELNYSNTYYWRVRSVIGEQYSDWSEEWSFTTKDVPVPVLSSPANNSTDTEIDLTLSWQDNAEADSYSIQVSENSDFSAHFVNQNLTTTDYILNNLDYKHNILLASKYYC